MESDLKYDHIILTRFNLKSNVTARDNFTVLDVNDQEWLNHRFNIFEKYCLPSVENQTNLNFQWIIFFDKNLPQIFRDRIENIKENFNQINPYYLDKLSLVGIQEACKRFVQNEYVITTRLDNDDLLARDYIQKVQNEFEFQNDLLLNFNSGYSFDSQNKIVGRIKKYHANPFMSYIEKNNPKLKTVVFLPHDQLASYSYLRNIDGKGMWMIHIHGTNIMNGFRGSPCYRLKSVKEEFPHLNSLKNIKIDLISLKYHLKFIKNRLIKRILQYVRKLIKVYLQNTNEK